MSKFNALKANEKYDRPYPKDTASQGKNKLLTRKVKFNNDDEVNMPAKQISGRQGLEIKPQITQFQQKLNNVLNQSANYTHSLTNISEPGVNTLNNESPTAKVITSESTPTPRAASANSETANPSDNMDWFSDPEAATNANNERDSITSNIEHNYANQIQVPTSNRFGLLINEELPIPCPATMPVAAETKKEKLPPIVVTQKVNDFKRFNSEIRSIITDYTIRYLKNTVNVYTFNKSDFTRLINEFRKSNVSHYTYTTKDEKQKKLVMKAAPDMDTEEVKKQIEANNIKVNECKQLLNKAGQPSQSYLIYTDVSTNLRNLKQIRRIGNVHTKWENYAKKNTITQCRRCQQYGHGTKNCGNTPRCVKCIKPHLTENCDLKKTLDSVPQCCNCHGPHTANYRGCPSRPKIEDPKKSTGYRSGKENPIDQSIKSYINPSNYNQAFPPLTKDDNPPNNNQASLPLNKNTSTQLKTNNHINNVSYATTTKNQSNKHSKTNSHTTNNSNFNDFQLLIKELNELNEICNLKNMIKMVQTLKAQLSNCTTPLDKLLVIQNLAENYE